MHDDAPLYSHTQGGRSVAFIVGIVMIGIAAMVIIILAAADRVPAYVWVTAGLPLLIVVPILWMFSRLHVEVDRVAVRWRFGAKGMNWSIPLIEIQSAQVVHNPWYYGLGIHFYPGGTLYNVGGSKGVEITRVSGRRIRIGTDEPDKLLAAIVSARR